MSFMSLVGVESRKLRRSGIVLLLAIAIVVLWIPSILNVHLNFGMQDIGISPENNFLVQGFLGMAWFMYPGSMVVCTVLMVMTERSNKGIVKMLSLPVNTAKLCMAKFVVLLFLSAAQMLMNVVMYYISAVIASKTQDYNFILPPLFVLKEAGLMYLASIPMLGVFWAIAVCVQTPIFSVGIGLASIVPSVLAINTELWFAYPMCYPFYVITAEYGKLAENMDVAEVSWFPLLPVAFSVTFLSLLISCSRFGQAERR